jgi:putative ABC transport system permease protein
MFALGFRKSFIRRFLICETGIIALAGSLAGVVSGMLVNYAIVKALNSVWRGAVQTDTISAFPGFMPVIIGFITTFSIALIVLWLLTGRFLRRLTEPEAGKNRSASPKANLIFTLVSGSAAIGFLALYLFTDSSSTVLSFTSGGLLFVFLMMIWRQILLSGNISSENFISSGYYRFHPGRLLMPVLLIAAGLFAVVITGINRMQANSGSLESKGGTGGYNIWAETTVPVREDMNGLRGIKALGLEEFEGKFSVVQAKRSSGDDASCLNLNHVTSPPLLGIDPAGFIKNGSFSFASLLPAADRKNPWEIITRKEKANVIFGFADQTVLEWGLKKKVSDTLLFRSESGELFRMVIAGGLKASVFQGSIITDSRWISEYFPSVSGNSVFLFKCEDTIFNKFSDAIRTRLDPFGVSVSPAVEKLEGYYQVTNTYLSVFTVLGGFGIILGVAGLGFVLRFNYNLRRKEFALMLASGFTESNLRKIIIGEQVFIILAGILTGLISGIVSTLPSISSGGGVQWLSLLAITSAIAVTGIISLSVAVRSISDIPLIASLRID